MNAESLLSHYERIADAPNAITRLRRFILDLAMRGKLVPQDPNDEPALELLERIAAEKARLVKAGEIRKPPALPAITDAETPFALPSTWTWIRVGDIFEYDAGTKRDPKELLQNRWLLELEDIEKDTSTVLARLRVNDRDSLSTKSEFEVGDILYGKLRPYLNKVVVADEPGYSTTEIVAIRPFLKLCPEYCALGFRRPDFVGYVERLGRGTKMPRLRTPDAIVAVFPLPPLAEQHRIVAKVNELMALCGRLEVARAEREARRDRLAAAVLARLNAPDPERFQDDLRFALAALPALTVRPDQLKQLRQTILNLAVRGKLVPQDPKDGTGRELIALLKKVRATREADGRVRKKTASAAIADEEKYLKLPSSWTWARVAELGQTQTGTSPSSANPDLFGSFVPFIKPADLDGSEINYDGPGLSEVGVEHSRLASARSVLMVCIGATLGKVNKTTRPVCFNQQINSLTPFLDGLSDYLTFALKASGFQALAWSKAGTGTLPIISKKKWEMLPLPPLAEQHRIVAKVDELIALCDRLEASLAIGENIRHHLLDALLHEALLPGDATVLEKPKAFSHG
jgi:type I restriction enzyme, S subunit